MTDSIANLRTQYHQVRESFDRLGGSLAENARGIREDQIPPDDRLIEEITRTREEFSSFQQAIIESARQTISPNQTLNGEASSLRGLEGLLDQIETYYAEAQALRTRATMLLDEVLSLRYRGNGQLAELRECQQRAASLRNHLSNSLSIDFMPELTAVANRNTAFADLLDLVSAGAEIDSETATNLSIKVEEAFGRRLVVEALRGQIILPEGNDPKPDPPSPPSPQPPAPFVPDQSTRDPATTEDLSKKALPFAAAAADESASYEAAPETATDESPIYDAIPEPATEESPVDDAVPEPATVESPIYDAVPETSTYESPIYDAVPETATYEAIPKSFEPPSGSFNLGSETPPVEIKPPVEARDPTSAPITPPAFTDEIVSRVTAHTSTTDNMYWAQTVQLSEAAETTRLADDAPPVQTIEDSELPMSDRPTLVEERLQAAPSEIASALASDLATLASSLASELKQRTPEATAPALFYGPARDEFSDSPKTSLDLNGAGFSAPNGVRVTEDLARYKSSLSDGSAREIVLSLLKPDAPPEPETFSSLLWQLVAENHLGLALNLSQSIERFYPDIPNRLPSQFIRALALSRVIRYDAGEVSTALKSELARFDDDFFSELEYDANIDWVSAINLLLAAIVLRPALLAPSAQAESVLANIRLSAGLDNLASYCRAIFDFAFYKKPFDSLSLSAQQNGRNLQADVEDLSQQARDWLGRAPRFDLKDGMAKKVWNNWLSNQGAVNSLLQPILSKDPTLPAMVDIVKKHVETFSTQSQIDFQIDKTNRELRGIEAPEITPEAHEQIYKHAREALDFGQRWIVLQESIERRRRDEPIDRDRDLRESVLELRDRVFEDIEKFRRAQRNQFVNCAAQLCLRAVNEIDWLLSGAEELKPEESAREALNAELLMLPEIPMNRRWEAERVGEEQIIRGVFETVADSRYDWKKAFDLRKAHEDHEATQRIIELLNAHRDHDIQLKDLATEREVHLRECRLALLSSVEEVREKIEAAVVAEWLDDDQRGEYIGHLEQIEREAPSCLRFFELKERLKNLNLALESHCLRMRVENETKRGAEIESLRQRIDSLRSNLKDSDYRRILETLEDGDLKMADHYLRIASRGDALPIRYDEAYYLKAFFPGALRNIITLSGSILSGGSLIEDARVMLGSDFQNEQIQRAINAWDQAKKGFRLSEEGLRDILTFLGFNLQSIEPFRSKIPGDLLLTLYPINKSQIAPIAKYGSGARHNYRTVILFEDPSPEEMVNFIATTTDSTPTIVFYFGSLIEEQRRKLARLCNESRSSFLVLDDLLLLQLCKHPEPRIEAFFHCTLPFSYANPYTPDEPAAPEIFFGRSLELNKLLEMNGASFVYGARRSGKTSLLQEARRRFEKRGAHGEWEKVAIYLDLDAENIGTLHPADFIWKRLTDALLEAVGPIEGSWDNVGAALMHTLVKKWLDGDQGRRLLILLDSADTFLRLDANEESARSAKLRSLLDEYGFQKRIKFVFAGGNQALRTSRIENHPLAQLGESFSIGPFLQDRDDIYAAIQLIEKVFASIGYEFEKPELILRIISFTGYQPSLIQLFCQQLIRSVTGSPSPAFDMEKSPPYLITSKQIHDVTERPELKKRFLESQLWTLELDKRYLVIAQILAYHYKPQSENLVDAEWVRRQALGWWPDGFREPHTLFDVRDTLGEMRELNLLRKVGERYKLQDVRLNALFGDRDETEQTLLKSNKLTASPTFEALHFRSAFTSQISRRSPLTAAQFYKLRVRENSVSMIFGSKASDLNSVDLYLAHMLPHEFVCMNKYASRADFIRTLNEVRPKSQTSRMMLYIPADCSWDEEWMVEAIKHIRKMSGKSHTMRVIFAADPVKTWRWLNLHPKSKIEMQLQGVKPLFSLSAWRDCFLRSWLEIIGIRANEAQRAQIMEVTGGWPILLQKYYAMIADNPREWSTLLEAFNDSIGDMREELQLSLGLHLTEPTSLLIAHQGSTITPQNSPTGALNLDEAAIERAVQWAELLGLATPIGDRDRKQLHWRLTPLVDRLLKL